MTLKLTEIQEEEVLILFGSQRGAAEAAARRIADELPAAVGFTNDSTGHDKNNTPEAQTRAKMIPKVMELDEWLEVAESQHITRVVIIVLSSFGMGGAPMNARQFRRRCDDLLNSIRQGKGAPSDSDETEPRNDEDAKNKHRMLLQDIHFAVLGLGDSSYKTYMTNPQRAYDTFVAAGASPILAMGAADSKNGADEQKKVIESWINQLWSQLDKALLPSCEISPEGRAKATRAFLSTL